MKTINFELSKRLNEAGVLDDIETEYEYFLALRTKYSPVEPNLYKTTQKSNFFTTSDMKYFEGWFKTLTSEEAIDLLPNSINGKTFAMNKRGGAYEIEYMENYYDMDYPSETGKTLLESVEKMLEYLLDNNLLGNAK